MSSHPQDKEGTKECHIHAAHIINVSNMYWSKCVLNFSLLDMEWSSFTGLSKINENK